MTVPQQVWEDDSCSGRIVSEGSVNNNNNNSSMKNDGITCSSEQLALSRFAFQLTSIIGGDDGSIADEIDVQEEAKLLMSLSCFTTKNMNNDTSTVDTTATASYSYSSTSSATTSTAPSTTATPSTTDHTGRITPSSDTSSCYSSSSTSSSKRHHSFCFTCPSLSLEDHSTATNSNCPKTDHHQQRQLKSIPSSVSSSSAADAASDSTTTTSIPSVLLGRSLKIDDKDALRLSSDAMGRNILQSYKKALHWRLKSWEHSLSCILMDKELSAERETMQALLTSREVKLLLALKAIESKLQVMDATTSFNVLPQKININNNDDTSSSSFSSTVAPPATKKQRLELVAVEETEEYEYQVAYAMTLEGCLNVHTPAGYCKIEMQVPGSMEGTFHSGGDLSQVRMDVNTDILAAMIEKSSRTLLRAAVEAWLKGEVDATEAPLSSSFSATVTETKKRKDCKGPTAKERVPTEPPVTTPAAVPIANTSTPKRKFPEEPSCMVVITPACNASPPFAVGGNSSDDCEDHGNNKPVSLSLPDSFALSDDGSSGKPSLRMLTTPKASPRRRRRQQRQEEGDPKIDQKKKLLPTVVTPHKTQHPEAIAASGVVPTLPLLVEVACAMVKK